MMLGLRGRFQPLRAGSVPLVDIVLGEVNENLAIASRTPTEAINLGCQVPDRFRADSRASGKRSWGRNVTVEAEMRSLFQSLFE